MRTESEPLPRFSEFEYRQWDTQFTDPRAAALAGDWVRYRRHAREARTVYARTRQRMAREQPCLEVRGMIFCHESRPHHAHPTPIQFALAGFYRSLADGHLEAWINHDRTRPIGSQAQGTLLVELDALGLQFSAVVPCRDVDAQALQRGPIQGASMSWQEERASWMAGDTRVISADLIELSVLVGTAPPVFRSHVVILPVTA
jgi:hypothetical protein